MAKCSDCNIFTGKCKYILFATIITPKQCGYLSKTKCGFFSKTCTSSIDIFGKRNVEHCSKCCPLDLCNAECKYYRFLNANLRVIFFL